ncbi:MAG: GyrI-like domain-containing protein [Candidatus Hydrogenedentes bacterium]|nr:GyrI-like domain-containing protein [Candidatus Hydrogenedentota bacterium]
MPGQKIDLYKLYKDEYVTPRKPILVKTKPAQYLAISGQGAPGSDRFSACIGALYAVAFTIKMTRKFARKQDYAVCKLEGQWFFEADPARIPMDKWQWKLLIRTPDFINETDRQQAVATLREKRKPHEVEEVKLETINEGQCVQMLHIGPYDREHETIALMRAFAEQKGLKLVGPHHEIYLSDPRRTPPERLKTILREPAKKS